ncbi:MAG: DUF2809 domain-containing protein [Parafilimonas sp.]
MKNKRWLYLILIAINIPLGLSTRYYNTYFSDIFKTYGGDTFAASCIFFGLRFIFLKVKLWRIAILNYIVCIAIETLQLYHAPWIEKIRHTPPFGILLGYGFLWSDWLCYAAGTIIAFAVAWFADNQV